MVREGETIYVTDRDDVIAEIHKPVSAPLTMISRWDAFLNAEERAGVLIRAKQKGASLNDLRMKLSPTPGPVDVQALLDETREDRS